MTLLFKNGCYAFKAIKYMLMYAFLADPPRLLTHRDGEAVGGGGPSKKLLPQLTHFLQVSWKYLE
jgi:hypothetical protein